MDSVADTIPRSLIEVYNLKSLHLIERLLITSCLKHHVSMINPTLDSN